MRPKAKMQTRRAEKSLYASYVTLNSTHFMSTNFSTRGLIKPLWNPIKNCVCLHMCVCLNISGECRHGPSDQSPVKKWWSIFRSWYCQSRVKLHVWVSLRVGFLAYCWAYQKTRKERKRGSTDGGTALEEREERNVMGKGFERGGRFSLPNDRGGFKFLSNWRFKVQKFISELREVKDI